MESIPDEIQKMDRIAERLKIWFQDHPEDKCYPSGTVPLRLRNGISLAVELVSFDEVLTWLRINDHKEIAHSLERERDSFLSDLQAVEQAIEIGEGPPLELIELRSKITGLMGKLKDTATAFKDKLKSENPTETGQKVSLVKEPSKIAMQAYLTLKSLGCSQKKCAEIMTKKLKRKKPLSQGQISKWNSECVAWLKANNLEVFPSEMTNKIITMAPNILDMGARTDGKRTGDPRHKKLVDPDGDIYD